MPDNQEIDVLILRQLARQPHTTQREFAKLLSVSLGRVNYCINALLDKGWIKAQNFKRSDKKLAYAYLLTPEGLENKARITASFLQRKRAEYDALRAEIEQLSAEIEVEDAPKALLPDAEQNA
ncbi:MarR family EPS-associated transcriptional regulator [Lamprobacter modestohalophilus]|uniref:MarR family EPS-associated transcriptional regulator n=1 Tax=Lamprobacter modestohalophilus TaxID=1064514 RepID=UPI0019083051